LESPIISLLIASSVMLGFLTGFVTGSGLSFQFLDDENSYFYQDLLVVSLVSGFGGYLLEGIA
jgi:hypothetical protein